jgi:O-antigen/teichoic acid export membrane protein
VNQENENPQTDFKVRELRKLRFSATLQIFAAIFFAGAAFIIGSAQGWGVISAVFIALATANIVFFIYIRKAMKTLSQN